METLKDSRIDRVDSGPETFDTALTEKELATGYTGECHVPCAGETGLMIKPLCKFPIHALLSQETANPAWGLRAPVGPTKGMSVIPAPWCLQELLPFPSDNRRWKSSPLSLALSYQLGSGRFY